jgi:hypothetical protein
MSIVNDALKKIEKQRDQASPKPSAVISKEINPEPNPVTSIKAPAKNNRFSLFEVLVLLGVIFAAAFLVKKFISKEKITVSTPSINIEGESITGLGQIVQTNMPLAQNQPSSSAIMGLFKPREERSQFALTGILYSDLNPAAIINDVILKQGDTINGAVVESIQEDLVKLSYAGQEIILQVQ